MPTVARRFRSPGTLYRRAIRRVLRRRDAFFASRSDHDMQLLREACRMANGLASLAFG